MAAGDLTTLANVRGYLSLTGTGDDVLLARLVSAASKFFAHYCSRVFESSSYTEIRHGTGGAALILRQAPVTSASSLQIDGQTIAARTGVGVAGWVLVDDSIYLDGGLAFTRGVANVMVAYTAGYATIPADLEQACVEACASWFRRRTRIDEQSKSLQAGGEVISFTLADIPNTARSVLDEYRRVVIP